MDATTNPSFTKPSKNASGPSLLPYIQAPPWMQRKNGAVLGILPRGAGR